MATEKKKKSTAYYINAVITVVVMLLGWVIPAPAPMTPVGIKLAFAILGGIYGWITCDTVWPSFAALVVFAFSGYTGGDAAFVLAGGNRTTLYILVLFFFAAIFITTDTAPIVAQRIVSLKMARGRPWVLVMLILIASFVPAIIIGGVPATLIIWSIIYAICDEVGMKPGCKWGAVMVVITAITATFGHNVLPFQSSNAGTFGVLSALDPTYSLPYGKFLIITILYAIIAIIVYWLYIKFIVKPDVSALMSYDTNKEIPKFNFAQKMVLWLFLALFILLMIPNTFPTTAIGALLKKLGNTGIVVTIVAIALLIKKDGKFVVDFKKVAAAVPWGAIMMTDAGLTISNTFGDDATGINLWVNQVVTPLFEGKSPVVLVLLIILGGLILTNMLNNGVVSFIMVPILFTFRDLMSPELFLAGMIMFMCEVNMAFVLPSGSTSAAILAANREWVKPKELFTYTGVGVIIVYVLGAIMLAIATGICAL